MSGNREAGHVRGAGDIAKLRDVGVQLLIDHGRAGQSRAQRAALPPCARALCLKADDLAVVGFLLGYSDKWHFWKRERGGKA